MAVSLEAAAQKWKRNAEAGARNWHGNEAAFCRGLAKFGLSEAQCMSGIGARYNQGVSSVGPGEFAQAIAQTPAQKWASRFLEGISR